MAAIFKTIWETSVTKNYCPVSLLFVVNKFFEKRKNNMLVDHLEKFGFFSDLQYGSDTSDTEKWLYSESKRNKANLDRWSDQKYQVLKVQ